MRGTAQIFDSAEPSTRVKVQGTLAVFSRGFWRGSFGFLITIHKNL